MHWVGLAVLCFFVVVPLLLIFQEWGNENVRKIVVDQIAVIMGLPMAGLFALLIVAVFQSTTGAVKFEATPAFKFEGAAGPIIFWVICFLAITTSIKMLWK
jgi:hypothetical protein